MRLLRKSIIRKLFVFFFVYALLLVLFSYFFNESGVVTFNYFLYSLLGALILFLGFYYFDIFLPLKKILFQMQALLAGKQYKKIYFTRLDEIGVIAHFFNRVTSGLAEVSYDLKDRDRMVDELTIASSLQRDILPLKSPIVKGMQIVAKNKPATELGGDSFNVFSIYDKTYVYVGDVTGHGVAAALIMTMVSSLVSVFSEEQSTAYGIVLNVNRYIKKHVKKAMFMTMVMLCWNHETQKLTYVGAGHEYILVYRASSGECEKIMSGGVALGMVPDNSKVISEKEIPLGEGDSVILYTDGITEARDSSGNLYGLDRLITAVKEFAPRYSADGLNFHIAEDVTTFMGETPQGDDMTLIVMKKDSSNDPTAVKDLSTTWEA